MPISRQEPTISSTVLLSLYNDLSGERETFDHGLDVFDIGLTELQDFHGHISLRKFVQIFEWLASALDDCWLGLKISQRSGPDALGALGYLFLSAGTLETAIQSLSRYLDAIQSASRLEVSYADDFVQVRYRIIDDSIAPRRQDSEYSIGLTWRYMKLLSKNRCRLRQVGFEHEQPPGPAALPRRIFGAPVFFGSGANEMILSREDFQRWHEGLDPHLFPILEEHITNTLAQSQSPESFADSVSQLLTERVLAQGVRTEVIADTLNISTVTVHRRLRCEGFRFKELVEAKRKAMAERLLRHSNLPMATVSSRLGFADPATFSRAFRRWNETTPRDYRKEIRKRSLDELRKSL